MNIRHIRHISRWYYPIPHELTLVMMMMMMIMMMIRRMIVCGATSRLDGTWTQLNRKMFFHGSLNVPIEHHPTIRYMVNNGYYKVMSNIPKMGHLPTPVFLIVH